MQRLTDDRGAVGVMVALLMIPLIGFAAIAIDVSGMWVQRQQLQTGADAGALAIAQNCAALRPECASAGTSAQVMSAANVNSGPSTALVTTLTSSKVTVKNSGVRDNLFAPILGHDQTPISASATAEWGAPVKGTSLLPLAFSYCEFKQQTGGGLPSATTATTIFFTKTSGVLGCTNQSGNLTPGGFAWLNNDPGTCHSTSAIGGIVSVSTGNSVPTGCSAADIAAALNKTVLLPLFDQAGGTGANATYRIYGYAAFTLTGYNFGGQYKSTPAPCGGNERCVRGYFVKYVDISDAFAYGFGGPALGSNVVTLTK